MKLFISLLLAMFAATVFAAEPAYWMKAYPGADQAKVDRCLVVAQAAYDANLKGNMDGHFWAILHKGNAYEACMDGDK